MGWFTRV